ncbi:hypothetical protein WN55_04833 [Dufourea novaeangliae]|uniref:Uncharacterized protein n=1 Tax=Dufourea novaeangliae TaxID=178035 RepID=A0A154NZI5_DUFNO|nr:hypothetical protein WN55_04833 [Dufourea novaeangliae]
MPPLPRRRRRRGCLRFSVSRGPVFPGFTVVFSVVATRDILYNSILCTSAKDHSVVLVHVTFIDNELISRPKYTMHTCGERHF